MGNNSKLKARVAEGAFDYQQKVIPPLAYLLMQSSLEELFGFLQKMHIQWTMNVNSKGQFTMRIFKWKITDEGADREQEFNFVGVNPNSPKAALCNALSRWLIYCREDFHGYIMSNWPDLEAAAQTNRRVARAAQAVRNHPEMIVPEES